MLPRVMFANADAGLMTTAEPSKPGSLVGILKLIVIGEVFSHYVRKAVT